MGKRRLMAMIAAFLLLAGACAAEGDETGSDEGGQDSEEEVTTTADGDMFGDMPTPCGDGELSVDPEEGHATDKLAIGVANDRSSDIRPGLNKEMWDASQAFVKWCNAQGGIGGLPIEIVDLDAALFEVETAMTRACSQVFMMAGGGWVQDNLTFTGKPESDFHLCGMADIPAFTVSPEKGESNGQVQPLPHVSTVTPNGWSTTVLELFPDEASTAVMVWGDLPSLEVISEQDTAALESTGVEVVEALTYPPTGLSDWTPLATQIINSGAGTLHFIGEPTNMGSLLVALGSQGWEGFPVTNTNMYDPTMVGSAGAENAAGTVIRSAFHPFEEAEDWPATQQFIDILNENVPDAKQALLGMQSFSSWLLFAQSANECGEANDGVLTRACILEAAADTEDWTAGGLHAPSSPGPEGGTPGNCFMLVTVNSSGGFERLHPEVGSDDDDVAGFHCEGELVEVPGAENLGVIGPNQPL